MAKGSCTVSSDSLPRCSGPVHSGWLVGGWQVACPWPLALLRTSPGSPSPSLGQREETRTARLASPHVLLHISPDAISLVQQPNTSSRAGHDPPRDGTSQHARPPGLGCIWPAFLGGQLILGLICSAFSADRIINQISKYLFVLWLPMVDATLYVLVISARVLPGCFMT